MTARSDPSAAKLGIGVALVLITLLLARDAAVGPASAVGWEEGLNARAALMVACGHIESLGALQYRPFCGGCTAEALVGAPLMRVFGPGRLVWKAVPALFHVVLLCAGAVALGGRRAGAAALGAWLLLEVGAPGWARALAVTGWGNHAEGAAVGLLGLALAGRSLPGRRWVGLGAGGALVGLATWISWSAGWAVAALVGWALWERRAAALVAVLAVPIGLAPLAARLRAFPIETADAVAFWTTIAPAPPDAALRWLWGDLVRGGMWATGASGGIDPVAALWWSAALALGLMGAGVAARRGGAGRVIGLSLAAAVGAWLLRYDAWDDNPAVVGFDWFNLRYRAALWPLLALGAAALARHRPPALAAVVVLAALGLGHRLAEPALAPELRTALAVSAHHAPDVTVPSGAPQRRLARQLGRPQDVAAAAAHLSDHADPLPLCRAHHAYELGRRVGLGGGPPPHGPPTAPSAAAAYTRGQTDGAATRRRAVP